MNMSFKVADVADRSYAFGSSAIEAVIKKAIVGMIAGAAASTAFAHVAMQTPTATAKEQLLASITEQTAKGADISPVAAGMAADADRAMKGEPKVLMTDQQKQVVVASATIAGAGGGYGTRMNGLAADRLMAAATEPKALTTDKERQQAVESVTIAGAGGGYGTRMNGLAADRLRATTG